MRILHGLTIDVFDFRVIKRVGQSFDNLIILAENILILMSIVIICGKLIMKYITVES